MIKSESARGTRTERKRHRSSSQTELLLVVWSWSGPARAAGKRWTSGEAQKTLHIAIFVGGERFRGGSPLRFAPFCSLARGKSISSAGRRRRCRHSSLSHYLSLSLSYPFALARDSPVTLGMPNSGPSSIGFQAHFRLVP